MKLHIERVISVAKPAATVYGIVSDLAFWNTWSPWIHMEPTAKTKITGKQGVGQKQSWDGDVIGAGNMEITKLENNKSVQMRLEFLKPWKNVAQVAFTFIEQGPNHCEVRWSMDCGLPLFMIFFKKMMTAYIQSDYDRGLKMLKEFAETGSVPSHSLFQGVKKQEPFQIVGKTTSCKIIDIATSMHRDFSEMNDLVKNHTLSPPLKAMAVTHEFNIPKGTCKYTAGFYYRADQDVKVPAGFTHEKYPEHSTLLVDHHGPYRFLGNPWSMAMTYQRGKKFKFLKKVPLYEVYVTLPDGRAEKDIHTQIFVPVKT